MAEYYFTKGIIRYKTNDWIIIEAPNSVVNYYKWWVEKLTWKKISTSYHGSHITVLAGKHEKPRNMAEWAKYDGKEIELKYFSTIYSREDTAEQDDGRGKKILARAQYFWLTVETPWIPKIRTGLGLKPFPKWPPHLTIGYGVF
jgi:hypothetical protein